MLLWQSAVNKQTWCVKGQWVVSPSSEFCPVFGAEKASQERPKEARVSLQENAMNVFFRSSPNSPDRWLFLAALSGQKTCSWKHIAVIRNSAPTPVAIRWRSRRAAWRPLYFHPVRERTQMWECEVDEETGQWLPGTLLPFGRFL